MASFYSFVDGSISHLSREYSKIGSLLQHIHHTVVSKLGFFLVLYIYIRCFEYLKTCANKYCRCRQSNRGNITGILYTTCIRCVQYCNSNVIIFISSSLNFHKSEPYGCELFTDHFPLLLESLSSHFWY